MRCINVISAVICVAGKLDLFSRARTPIFSTIGVSFKNSALSVIAGPLVLLLRGVPDDGY